MYEYQVISWTFVQILYDTDLMRFRIIQNPIPLNAARRPQES